MDDDFNTAGAIGVMHDLAGGINSFLEQHRADPHRQPEIIQAASAATQTLRRLGRLLGLFQTTTQRPAPKEPELVDQLMKLFIQLRNDARKGKNFALADEVRDRLSGLGITLEDRQNGTRWRIEPRC